MKSQQPEMNTEQRRDKQKSRLWKALVVMVKYRLIKYSRKGIL